MPNNTEKAVKAVKKDVKSNINKCNCGQAKYKQWALCNKCMIKKWSSFLLPFERTKGNKMECLICNQQVEEFCCTRSNNLNHKDNQYTKEPIVMCNVCLKEANEEAIEGPAKSGSKQFIIAEFFREMYKRTFHEKWVQDTADKFGKCDWCKESCKSVYTNLSKIPNQILNMYGKDIQCRKIACLCGICYCKEVYDEDATKCLWCDDEYCVCYDNTTHGGVYNMTEAIKIMKARTEAEINAQKNVKVPAESSSDEEEVEHPWRKYDLEDLESSDEEESEDEDESSDTTVSDESSRHDDSADSEFAGNDDSKSADSKSEEVIDLTESDEEEEPLINYKRKKSCNGSNNKKTKK